MVFVRRLGWLFSGTLEDVPGARIWIVLREGSDRRALRIAVPIWPVAPKRVIVDILFIFYSG